MSSTPFSTFKHCVVSRSKVKYFNIMGPSGGSSGEVVFSLTLECNITRTAKAGNRWPLARMEYEGVGTKRNFTTNQAVDIPSDKEGVCSVLCGLMRTVTPLQDLNLTGLQWEEILLEPQVPLLKSLAREVCQTGCIVHVTIVLEVEPQIKFKASKALLAICMEVASAGCLDCSICLDEAAIPAVHVPCCSRTFHTECLTQWFKQRSTCLSCRVHLSRFLHPLVQIFF